MRRKSTSKMGLWIVIFLGSAFSVNTIRRNVNSRTDQALAKITRTLSTDALIVSNVLRTLLLR
ncbi:hypothetical protein J2I47_03360 [Fibrella sp. HMF5335]|uniref:Uncharacterized protein n=1 Tax=Fibrella rubiginis TaxID=2817060 RepID=A0A939GE57_9BACT|nr:hypothetical protein [Fibrella rubiginis]MBO0935579.1 hypothetical protein [Fibrella rubiginis]